MKQYCRYCFYAVLNDGFFFCEAKYQCLPERKAKQVNHCKQFEFNPNDLLRMGENGGFMQYKPRDKSKKIENYSLFD